MQDFRKLRVWEKAHALTLRVFRATQRLPRRGYAGLLSQIRRATLSIPANIAEGCGHDGNRELARFLQIALASATELEYHLLLASDLALLDRRSYEDLEARLKQVKRMLAVLLRRVRERLDEPVRGDGPQPLPPDTDH